MGVKPLTPITVKNSYLSLARISHAQLCFAEQLTHEESKHFAHKSSAEGIHEVSV